MKALLITCLLAMSASSPMANEQTQTVYICTGGSSKAYHAKKDCTGLNNCQAEIREISLAKAKEMKRRPCKKCYK